MTQEQIDYYNAIYIPSSRPANQALQIKFMRNLLYTLLCLATAMVGYHIHGSIFWSIVDFIFAPLAICKWLVCHELTLTVIKQTFDFLNH